MSVTHFNPSGPAGYFDRQEFIFHVKTVRVVIDEEVIQFPCIGLYHKATDFPVGYPGYERWLFDMRKSEMQRSQTLCGKAAYLCKFLNFVLWETDCDKISDITQNHFRNFMIWYKHKDDGVPRNPEHWDRGVMCVTKFLIAYIKMNQNLFEFHMNPEELITTTVVESRGGRGKIVVSELNRMFVKPPKKKEKKNRLLLRGHLYMLLYEAKKYDPMITLAIMLQAYAGLREGEVVNLTFDRVHRIEKGFGKIEKIVLSLPEKAEFFKEHSGKTDPGTIKKPRTTQEVYSDFLEDVLQELDSHEMLLETCGRAITGEAPLFVDKRGRPMTVAAYTSRLKKLFNEHFIPDIRKYCEQEGIMAENAPFIEAYERSYLGAHMLRHWFTMYLLNCTNLSEAEIKEWRGDSAGESMYDYIHVNWDFLRNYESFVFLFQSTVAKEIL